MPSPTNGNLSVVITLPDGTQVTVAQSGGGAATRRDDFIGPNFTQQCYAKSIALTVPNNYGVNVTTQMTVFLRPDAVGSRREAVFELAYLDPSGDPASVTADTKAVNMKPYNGHAYAYTVQVYDNGVLQADYLGRTIINVPLHYFMARWRWQSAQRPIVNTAAFLIANKLVPPYGFAPGKMQWLDNSSGFFSYTNPMDTPGIDKGIGDTGERYDIGPVTEQNATWLLVNALSSAQKLAMTATQGFSGSNVPTPAADAEAAMRGNAEASGSGFWLWRDNNTGAPLNLLTYPNAALSYGYLPTPYLNSLPKLVPDTSSASYTASCDSSGVMTVTAVAAGTILVNDPVADSPLDYWQAITQYVHPNYGVVPSYLAIQSQLTGTTGGIGTYQLARGNSLPFVAWTSRAVYSNGFWNNASQPDNGWGPDSAHFPSLSFIAFMATGDPYFLENQQFETIFTTIWDAGVYFTPGQDVRFPNGAAIPGIGQTRAFAWELRNLIYSRKASELAETWGTLPNWILPSSVWRTVSQNTKLFFDSYVNNPTNAGSKLFLGPRMLSDGAFTFNYLVAVFNIAVWFGYSEWAAAAAWKTQLLVHLGDGKHGWPPSFTGIYGLIFGPAFDFHDENPGSPSNTPDGSYWASWADAWDKLSHYPPGYPNFGATTTFPWILVDFLTQGQVDALHADPANGGVPIYPAGFGWASAYTMRSALALATMNGVDGAAFALSVQDPYVAQMTNVANGGLAARWAFPTTVAPSPPAPPSSVVPMSSRYVGYWPS